MFEKEEQVTIWLRFGWDLPEEVDSHGALISAFRYGTLYSNTESMEVQIYGSHCCFLRLYEVWYRSLSIPWLLLAAINTTCLLSQCSTGQMLNFNVIAFPTPS